MEAVNIPLYRTVMRVIALVVMFRGIVAYDCCSGKVCNDNWDEFDSSTDHCCMLPSGGKMIEETAVGSCSCPSLQTCDHGPNAPLISEPVPTGGISAPGISSPLFLYVAIGCLTVVTITVVLLLCMGYHKLASQYEDLRTKLERQPINQPIYDQQHMLSQYGHSSQPNRIHQPNMQPVVRLPTNEDPRSALYAYQDAIKRFLEENKIHGQEEPTQPSRKETETYAQAQSA